MHQTYKNIKKLREEKRISQEQLANLTGYTSRSTITRIENGEIDLSLSKIEQFAKVFGIEPGELVGWEDDAAVQSEKNNAFVQEKDFLFSDIEKDIFQKTKQLNSEGLSKLTEYADDLISSGKYEKVKRDERAI